MMEASRDFTTFIREFGLSVVIVLFVGWIIWAIVNTFIPKLAEALAERIKAGTKLVEVTTSTVEKLPEVIAQSGKETREAIASYEKAVISSEARILDAFKSTLIAIKDEIFDARQEEIKKGLNKLSKSKDPDTDPTGTGTKQR